MEKEARKLVFLLTPWIFLLVLLPLFYADFLWQTNIQFEQGLPNPETRSSSIVINKSVEEKQESLDFLLSRLVKGEDQAKLKATGFVCTTEVYSKHCVANQPVRIEMGTMTVSIPTVLQQEEMEIRPYARQEDEILLKKVTPVKILLLQGNIPVCQYNHQVPAVIFSSSGFVGNVFHEINEIIIPLYITSRLFKSRVRFVLEDYSPSFVRKYGKLLAHLSSYQVMNPASNQTVHCFPGAVVGLKFHGHLALNSSDIPKGLSVRDFREFLRHSLNLKYSHVSQIKSPPRLLLLSRTTTRRILNEDEVVAMMQDLGFQVIVIARSKVVSNLNTFSNLINSCSVFVGAHGAGLTNELFLPDGAVMVQLDLIGLEWAAATYYGDPARAMGVHYLRYMIEPEESSLLKVFGSRKHRAITNPRALPVEAGKQVYLNGQNARINVARFRDTMVEAMSLVRDSPL